MTEEQIALLNAVYALVACAKRSEALDLIFESFDKLFHVGRFTDVDAILKDAELAKLDSFSIVGLLTASFAAKIRLEHRDDLWLRARKFIIDSGRDPQDVDEMLLGLR